MREETGMKEREPTAGALVEPDSPRPITWLVQVGSASAPLRSPRIISLEGREHVILGRREPAAAASPASIGVDDQWMSARHAELSRTGEGWRLSDLGSSNGTLTWGRRRSTGLLANGDVFETGTTFWLFRSLTLGEAPPSEPAGEGVLRTLCPQVMTLHRNLEKVATSRVPLVLQGATGTGKEVLARAVHERSGRTGRMVALDVATIPSARVAEELFGTGPAAVTSDGPRMGRLRSADGGTVLLDQLGDMPSEVQMALLRVIQDGWVTPVGTDEPQRIDVRFIGTTHYDMEALVDRGTFRADLWSRLKGFVFQVPTLKERLEDLGLLVARFLRRFGLEELVFSPSAYRALLGYAWPHNIRELERCIESAATLYDGRRVERTDLPHDVQMYRAPEASDERTTEDHRERELVRLLTAHHGNVSAVARSMGYSRMQVHRWMKQMNVDPKAFRGA